MAKGKPRFKKFIGFVYVAFACVMLYSLVVNVQRVYQRQQDLTQLEERRNALQKEKEELKEEVELLSDEDYVVIYAREHYIFTKDGEEVATLPETKK